MSEGNDKLDRIISKIDHLEELVSCPETGLIVKVDRIEQRLPHKLEVRLDRLEVSEARRQKLTWSAVGAAVTALIGAAWALLTGRGTP